MLFHRNSGFSRTSLVFLCFGVFVSAFLAYKSFQRFRFKSQFVRCESNLAVLHSGLMQAAEATAEKRFHWQVPNWRKTNQNEPLDQTFTYLSTLSNYIASPKIFACPADTRKRASDWSTNISGFLHSSKQDNAVSYFMGIDARVGRYTQLLLGDRNIIELRMSGCSQVGGIPLPYLDRAYAQAHRIKWDNRQMHGERGHIVDIAGNVLLLNSRRLSERVIANDDAYRNHFVFPQPYGADKR